MAQDNKVAALQQYAEKVKRIFTDESRYRDLTARKVEKAVEKLTTLGEAVDPDKSIADLMNMHCEWEDYGSEYKKCLAEVEVEDIYRGRDRLKSDDPSRISHSRSRSRKSKHSRKRSQVDNADNLSSDTDISDIDGFDPVSNNRKKTEDNNKKRVSGSVRREIDYVLYCINKVTRREVYHSSGLKNIIARATGGTYNPDKLKTTYNLVNLYDPLMTHLLIFTFFNEATNCLMDNSNNNNMVLSTKYNDSKIWFRNQISEDALKVTSCCINTALIEIFNNSHLAVDELSEHYSKKIELMKSDAIYKLRETFHYDVCDTICWNHYFGSCQGGCGLRHVCPMNKCNNTDHFVWDCIQFPLKNNVKKTIRIGIQNARNYRRRGGYRGRGRSRGYRGGYRGFRGGYQAPVAQGYNHNMGPPPPAHNGNAPRP